MARQAEATKQAIAVLDASVVVELLLNDTASLPRGYTFVAPAHLDAEVSSALARLWRAGTISSRAVDDMLAGLAEFGVDRMPLQPLLAAAFELRENVTQRDSLYVALARLLDAVLVTRDQRLASVCRQLKLCSVVTWNEG
ncbi:MAG: type II toxin-antitoxin system VapC family toxin [Ilumatobacteraceae bacterium]